MSNNNKECKHKRIQEYTEYCLDCGKNLYDTDTKGSKKEKEKDNTPWYESDW